MASLNNNLFHIFKPLSANQTLESAVFAHALICWASPAAFRTECRIRFGHSTRRSFVTGVVEGAVEVVEFSHGIAIGYPVAFGRRVRDCFDKFDLCE